MSKENSMSKSLQFLSGGGEMGALMRAYNWKSSPLGPVDNWPQSLLTTLGILLHSKFPMFLFWGFQHICFYNDAYRPSLGNDGKHPSILGTKGEEAWPEIWHIIKPLIDQVLTGGEATWSEDQLIPIYRNGKIEDVYWTFSYSQVNDESGLPAGVFVTCAETTENVDNFKKIAEINDQLSFAIEATQLGTWDYNPITNKFIGNNRLKDWFGLPHEMEVELLLAIAVMAEKDRSRVSQAIQKALQYDSGGLYDIEYTIINPVTKQERIVRAKGKSLFGDDKKAYRFSGTLQDITEEATGRRKTEANENQFRIFADSIQNLAWIANADGWIYWYNQRWYDYTDTTLDEMQGWGWNKVHHPDHIEKVVEFVKEAWKKDEAFELTFPLRRHDGEYRWFLTRAYPVKDATGNIERWIGTNTDINEQKIAEQRKDEFISIASHEMKTPLTTAKGYIELLQLSVSKENQTALFATKARQSIERLHNLVTELLDASKIQNGQLNYNMTTFDFTKLVDETIENIQHSAKNHSIQKTGSLTQQITGDKERLQQVLINLLNNAVKYSPKGDKVLVKIEEHDNKIQVSVQDFGIGISGKHLDKIFDRYYRVQENANYFQGLGIGLYISNNIIKRHNGTMWAESEPAKGSIFYFTLPL